MAEQAANDLGARLKAARSAAKLTQSALGEAAGVTGPYVAMLELGHRKNPRARELEALARALGVTTGWLLHGEQAPEGGAA